ncbi:polysaccharide deacetylase [Aquipluma nitroreducens]|uniref:Polysaccharide deacetylase n=1 Tax=Aquipluma nitroreducens TaxID=2010828 RepID=A0A5K7S3W1_9BACT|nr:polysaccharide deacetylase [Aquipluma nitroreducens]
MFQTFESSLKHINKRAIILRHDVDLLPRNSLRFAQIQANLNIKGSYYFRAVPESWDEQIIKEIANLGHEVGYHYETMDTTNGDIDKAWDQFRTHLDELRKLTDVETICMHGSPRSKYDNKQLWVKYDYKTLGLIGEPYFDIDFSKVGYLTDTGRQWNGNKVSIRDKVNSSFNFNFRSTQDIIRSVNQLPDQIMFTFHPQRWNDNWFLWTKELVLQNVKNQVKRILIR